MLIDDIRGVLKWGGGVTFAELSRIEGFHGDREIYAENIVFWSEISTEAVTAIRQILEEGEYKFTLTSPMVYAADSAMLNLPIAKRNHKYKTKHWLPVALKRNA